MAALDDLVNENDKFLEEVEKMKREMEGEVSEGCQDHDDGSDDSSEEYGNKTTFTNINVKKFREPKGKKGAKKKRKRSS